MTTPLTRGTQVLYVPRHAHGNTQHPDVEAGFVTAVRADVAYCRYWSKHSPGELRTKANGEATLIDMIVIRDTVPPQQVAKALATICAEVTT